MSFWSKIVWPWLSKAFKYILSLFERTATELAKIIPERIIEPIKLKIIEVSKDTTLTGDQKMQLVKEYAINLLGQEFSSIGHSALDTFIQVVYQDLKNQQLA